MAQHDYVIDNQGASPARTDINNALQAIASQNSGATAPSTTVANMIWYDTANDLLKMRNEANSGWITLGTVDQTNNVFNPNFLPATQAEAEAGTDNVKGMTPLRVKQAVAALSPAEKYPYKNIVVRPSSGTFTPIAGVTEYMVVVYGGGGGGGSGATGSGTWTGGTGGRGGIAANKLTISSPVTFTIGAGGTGSNSGTGGTGGTTTFSTLTANGGTGGTSGVGGGPNGSTGSTGTTSGDWNLTYANYTAPLNDLITFALDYANNTTGTTTAVAYTLGGGNGAGRGGTGEVGATGNNASGGVGGAVLIFY